jgi:hypothetical protein
MSEVDPMERAEETGQLLSFARAGGKQSSLRPSAVAGRVTTGSIGQDDCSAGSGIAC